MAEAERKHSTPFTLYLGSFQGCEWMNLSDAFCRFFRVNFATFFA
jgi:hypothetical protein